jgi:hypothetical protein
LFFEFEHRIGNLFNCNNSWTFVNNTTIFLHCKKMTKHWINYIDNQKL